MKGKIDGLLQMVANFVRIENRDGIFRNRLYDRNDVDFLHAQLTHAQWPTIFIEHAIRPFHLARDKEHRESSPTMRPQPR